MAAPDPIELAYQMQMRRLDEYDKPHLEMQKDIARWQNEYNKNQLAQQGSQYDRDLAEKIRQYGGNMDFERFRDLRNRALTEQDLYARTGLNATQLMQQEEMNRIDQVLRGGAQADQKQLAQLGLSADVIKQMQAASSDAERLNIAHKELANNAKATGIGAYTNAGQLRQGNQRLGVDAGLGAENAGFNRERFAAEMGNNLNDQAMKRAQLLAGMSGPENAFKQMRALRGLDKQGNLKLAEILRGEAPVAQGAGNQGEAARAMSMNTIADQLGSGGSEIKGSSGTDIIQELMNRNKTGTSSGIQNVQGIANDVTRDPEGAAGRGLMGIGGELANQAEMGKYTTPGVDDQNDLSKFLNDKGRAGGSENDDFVNDLKGKIDNSATRDILSGIAGANTAAGTAGNAATLVDRDNYAEKISQAATTMMASDAYKNASPEERRMQMSSIYKDTIPGITQAQAEEMNDTMHNMSAASGGGAPDITMMNNAIKANLAKGAVAGTRTGVGAGTRMTTAMNQFDQRNPAPQAAPFNPAVETRQDFENRTSESSEYGQQLKDYQRRRDQAGQNLWRNEGLTPEQAAQASGAAKNYYLNSGNASPMNPAQLGGMVNAARDGRPIQSPAYGGYDTPTPTGPSGGGDRLGGFMLDGPGSDWRQGGPAPTSRGGDQMGGMADWQGGGLQAGPPQQGPNANITSSAQRYGSTGANPPPRPERMGGDMMELANRMPQTGMRLGPDGNAWGGPIPSSGARPQEEINPYGRGGSQYQGQPDRSWIQPQPPPPMGPNDRPLGGGPQEMGGMMNAARDAGISSMEMRPQDWGPGRGPGMNVNRDDTRLSVHRAALDTDRNFAQDSASGYGGAAPGKQQFSTPVPGAQPPPMQANRPPTVGVGMAANKPAAAPAAGVGMAANKPAQANPGNPDFTGVTPKPAPAPAQPSWEEKQAGAFTSGLPAANKINARNYMRLNDSEKKFTLAGYEDAGQSASDVQETIQRSLPKAAGPKVGRMM